MVTSSPGSGLTPNPDYTAARLNWEQWADFSTRRLERELLEQLQRSDPIPTTGRAAFLPPALPALGAAVAVNAVPAVSPEQRAQWPDHAGDSFFMACTSLQRQGQLSGKQTRRLQAFVSTRAKLLDDLHRAQLQAAALPLADQSAFLARFAESQAAALHALAEDEESIRLDLTQRRPLGGYENGVGLTVVPDQARNLPPIALGFIFAAQFEPGLSATQRELLMGIVQDFEQDPEKAAASFSFWPARARLSLAADIPADLVPRIQGLQELKQQLALELIQLLRHQGRDADATQRRQAVAALTARQAPVLASLESLAEELRPRLATIYGTARPVPVDAPAELLQQVALAYARKAALQLSVSSELRDLRQLLPNDRIEVIQQGRAPVIIRTAGAASNKAPPLTPAEEKALAGRLQ
ncbi:MAG TPA: hypothetical protein VG734_04020 [Lacunisphaera sp.]|nr:hypothetical protein [Lacunisphaera sp.]